MASILVVHDHPTIRHMIKRYLERCEHTVTTVPNARTAFEVADSDTDVVMADIDMPGMGGMGLIQRLRERGLFAPVVLTSDRFPHPEEAATAAFILLKPFAPDQLLDAIGAALGEATGTNPAASVPSQAVAR